MLIDENLNNDKLKYYLLNYMNDLEFIRQFSKKKELYLDFFDYILDDKKCINLIESDYNLNVIISKLIDTNIHTYFDDNTYNNIYNKFSKIRLSKDISENGNQINEISI